MIADRETDRLHLADVLPGKHPEFFASLSRVLSAAGIPFELLPGTKDVWARDFMPIQVREDKFVLFRYDPDYLRAKRWQHLRSDGDQICRDIGQDVVRSELRVDGGNVVKCRDRVVMCDKVIAENPGWASGKISAELEARFETDRLTFIPTDPEDFTGHADGLVRFVGPDTVVINEYPRKHGFKAKLVKALSQAGIDHLEIPYNPYGNRNLMQANGCYINYLEMRQAVIVPAFGLPEDDRAVRVVESWFNDRPVLWVDCNAIADQGGVLNCVTWTLKAPAPAGRLP